MKAGKTSHGVPLKLVDLSLRGIEMLLKECRCSLLVTHRQARQRRSSVAQVHAVVENAVRLLIYASGGGIGR